MGERKGEEERRKRGERIVKREEGKGGKGKKKAEMGVKRKEGKGNRKRKGI